MVKKLVHLYLTAKVEICEAGHTDEIAWAEAVEFADAIERVFLFEAAWVIFNSGFRASTVDAKWKEITRAFRNFSSAEDMVSHSGDCRAAALKVFGNRAKVDAVLGVARIVAVEGWPNIKKKIALGGPAYLQRFPFIGPITSFHLARNLGLEFVKPDRHLVRIAVAAGYDNKHGVEHMCNVLRAETGDRLGVVDVVLWRWATTTDNYEQRVREAVHG